jgi:2-polyprenyl-6-hydroxyphenyl methylase/3-demethylubiquinone-9 3-methyltransferase
MSAQPELHAGARFAFGENWRRFLSTIDEGRIAEAQASLQEMLQTDSLQGLRFLDIGSGSGLMSLVARRLGATVHSFDYDAQSVACTREMRRRYCPEDGQWRVEEGSALDRDYLHSLGTFDIVYSWGVLHHTGAMWLGIDNAISRVGAGNGLLFIAIYNDQGAKSHAWWLIKRCYNGLPGPCRGPFAAAGWILTTLLAILKHTLRLRPMVALAPLFRDRLGRGMSAKYDWTDWIGGFPYEFATVDVLRSYVEARGFTLIVARRTTGWGCNELIFRRKACAA